MSIKEKTLAERFLKFKPIVEDNGCWRWSGHINKSNGYGDFHFQKKVRGAHRVSYEHYVGPIPEGHQVRHSCDNRWCFNPEHLSTGTIADNMQDKTDRGRQAKGSRDGNSKLKEHQVVVIWTRLRRGDKQVEIARDFGVHQTNISYINVGKTWHHLTSTL